MTRSGDLTERIAFDQRVETDDGYGGKIGGFEEQFVVAAEIVYLRGGEQVMAARMEGRQPVIIRIRSSSDAWSIDTNWRARDARYGTEYAIKSVAPARDDARFVDITAVTGEEA